jgi:hypothetical protein
LKSKCVGHEGFHGATILSVDFERKRRKDIEKLLIYLLILDSKYDKIPYMTSISL